MNTVKLQGIEYPVKFTLKSAVDFKKLTGKSLFNLDIASLKDEPGDMVALIAVGLGKPADEVAEMVNFADLVPVFEAITAELKGETPDPLAAPGPSAA